MNERITVATAKPTRARSRRTPQVVTCLGETMALLAPMVPGPLENAEELLLHVGGAESNVAMYLAGNGVPARWISRVGDDPFGALIRRVVGDAGVDVTGVQIDPTRPTGVYFKSQGPDGNTVHYYRRGSAASAMSPEFLRQTGVTTASVLHLSGITAALSDSCRELVEAALRKQRPTAPLVSFDVNYRPKLRRDQPADLLLDLARRADIVFVGLDEAATLWNTTDPESVRKLLRQPPLLVVKDGDRVATAFDGTDSLSVPALTVDVVEPVGAGDAFAAGFLTGMVEGWDLQMRLRLGHLTAAAALRVAGDIGPLLPPTVRAELLAADDDAWATAVIRADTD